MGRELPRLLRNKPVGLAHPRPIQGVADRARIREVGLLHAQRNVVVQGGEAGRFAHVDQGDDQLGPGQGVPDGMWQIDPVRRMDVAVGLKLDDAAMIRAP